MRIIVGRAWCPGADVGRGDEIFRLGTAVRLGRVAEREDAIE